MRKGRVGWVDPRDPRYPRLMERELRVPADLLEGWEGFGDFALPEGVDDLGDLVHGRMLRGARKSAAAGGKKRQAMGNPELAGSGAGA